MTAPRRRGRRSSLPGDVIAERLLAGETAKALAREYGVPLSTLRHYAPPSRSIRLPADLAAAWDAAGDEVIRAALRLCILPSPQEPETPPRVDPTRLPLLPIEDPPS